MNNQTLNEIIKRDLDACYFSITIIKSSIYFSFGNDYITKRNVITFVGCNINGVRKYISSVFEDEFNKTSAWYDLFLLWKKKNLNDIFYFVITDNKYIKDAINLAFPDCTCLKSCFNSIDKISNFFSNSYINDSTAKLAKIYNSCDINQFNLNVSNFFEEVINLPFIKDIVKEDFKDFSSYFNMDFTLRKNIFSFYFFRDFRKSLIKLANKTEFSSINDFQILLINDIQRFEKRRYCPINEWNQILSILYRDRKDLISKYL